MKVYLVLLNDTHGDPEPFIYLDKQKAIDEAKEMALGMVDGDSSMLEETFYPVIEDEWIGHIKYSEESNIHIREVAVIK